jgi:hypothetical protein
VADAVYGPEAIPAVHTLPATWSAEASARCEEKVSQKQFMRPLMMAACLMHLESAAVALFGVEGMHPQSWTGKLLCIILPISTGSASWG